MLEIPKVVKVIGKIHIVRIDQFLWAKLLIMPYFLKGKVLAYKWEYSKHVHIYEHYLIQYGFI